MRPNLDQLYKLTHRRIALANAISKIDLTIHNIMTSDQKAKRKFKRTTTPTRTLRKITTEQTVLKWFDKHSGKHRLPEVVSGVKVGEPYLRKTLRKLNEKGTLAHQGTRRGGYEWEKVA